MSIQEVISPTFHRPSVPASSYRLRGRWLNAARITWVLLAAYGLIVFTMSVGPYFDSLSQACLDGPNQCPVYAPGLRGAAALQGWGIPLTIYASYFVALDFLILVLFVLPGVFVLRYRSDTLIGFFMALTMLCFGIFLIPELTWTFVDAYPGHAPVFAIVFGAVTAAFVPMLFLFPDGRFVPAWTAWVALVMYVSMSLTGVAAILAPRFYMAAEPYQMPINLLAFGVAIYAQIYRYARVSDANERRQSQWGIVGIVAMAFGGLLWSLLFMSLALPDGPVDIAVNVLGVAACYFSAVAFLVSFAIAIFRYRLWDIHVIINTTLVYVSLTALVIGMYVLIVGALGILFQTQANLPIALVATGVVALLLQPARARLQRAVNRLTYGERDDPYTVLARLGKELQNTAMPQEALQSLVETIAGALKLPYVAIELVEQEQAFGGAAVGAPVAETTALPMRYQNETVGQLVLSPRSPGETFSQQECQLLEDIAGQAGALAAAVRLNLALQRSRERIVLAREEERRRIRRDLHDELGPTLASQTFRLDAALELLDTFPQEAAVVLTQLKAQNRETVAGIRRLVYELRPPALDELGLAAALRAHVAHLGYGEGRTQVVVDTSPESLPALPAAIEVAAYRIALEAMNNTMRHARAGFCTVTLTMHGETHRHLLVEIEDDGIGMQDPVSPGIGLSSMRERSEEIGGSCQFMNRPDGGVVVRAMLPVAAPST